MKFDLHCHSHFSDGALSPQALLTRAKEREINVLALTDHDTIAGLHLARQAADENGIIFINGVEFSSQWGKVGAHIVALGVKLDSPVLDFAIKHQENARVNRSEQIAARLAKAGFTGSLTAAQLIAGEAIVGRPHFAQHLVNIGAVNNINTAFKKYLGAGKPADVKYQWPDMKTVIEWVHAAGGIAVLAHPCKYDLTRTKMCAMIKDFAQAGGDAMEVISGLQQSTLTDDLVRIANANHLAASCGSDFHLPNQPWQDLGCYQGLPENCRPVWEMLGFAA